MKKQIVVRTYPNGYRHTTGYLSDALQEGYAVVMANPFDLNNGKEKGTEYILEKESEDEE